MLDTTGDNYLWNYDDDEAEANYPNTCLMNTYFIEILIGIHTMTLLPLKTIRYMKSLLHHMTKQIVLKDFKWTNI